MPLYDYQCGTCNKVQRSVHNTADKCEDGPECCGSVSRLVWLKTPGFMGASQFESYLSPCDGRPITSEAARREDLARNNCVPYEDGIKQDQMRNLAKDEVETERFVDSIVRQTVEIQSYQSA